MKKQKREGKKSVFYCFIRKKCQQETFNVQTTQTPGQYKSLIFKWCSQSDLNTGVVELGQGKRMSAWLFPGGERERQTQREKGRVGK